MPGRLKRSVSFSSKKWIDRIIACQILTGHEKGVLSLSWCKQDADLLLSCGKDNRALCWNPQTSDIIGEVCFSSDSALTFVNKILASFCS
jgi:WD40 repeat protein